MGVDELIKLSMRSLLANKLRSILTTLGIIIGVFAVIILVSIGTGVQSYITNQISGLGSNLIFVIPGRIGGARTPGGIQTNKLLLSDAAMLENKLKDIAQVGPVIQKSATVKYGNLSDKAVSIVGTTANYPETVKISIEKGVFFTHSQARAGTRVALVAHTVVATLFPTTDPMGKAITVSGTRYTVIGVLKKRGSIFGIDQDNTVIIPITAAKRQFGVSNVNTIYLSAKTVELVPVVKARASQLLLKRLSEDDFSLQTQESTLDTIKNVTNILSAALGGIAGISLLVGGIGIMNIMLVSVTERTREIGLRKAVGARRVDILRQFLLEAVFLSLIGGIIGIILGIGGSVVLAKFFVSSITTWSVLVAFTFSCLVGVIFGMAPAIRASNLSPIEALRHE